MANGGSDPHGMVNDTGFVFKTHQRVEGHGELRGDRGAHELGAGRGDAGSVRSVGQRRRQSGGSGRDRPGSPSRTEDEAALDPGVDG